MKRSKILLAGALTVLSFIAYSPAKASGPTKSGDDLCSGAKDKWNDWNNSNKNNEPTTTKGSGNGSAPGLPINGYAWFLTISGAAIGYKVISDRVKTKRI